MPVSRPVSPYPKDLQPIDPEQWVLRFNRLLAHWNPELTPAAARRTAEDWQRSLGALGPVQAFDLYRRVASDALARSRARKVPSPSVPESPLTDMLLRIAAAGCHSELSRLLAGFTVASGGGPIPAELTAAVMARQLRLLSSDEEFVRLAKSAMDAAVEPPKS